MKGAFMTMRVPVLHRTLHVPAACLAMAVVGAIGGTPASAEYCRLAHERRAVDEASTADQRMLSIPLGTWRALAAPGCGHVAAPSRDAGLAARGAIGRPAFSAMTARVPPPTAGSAGLRVAIDPETGELGMPSAEQARRMDLHVGSSLDRSDAGLRAILRPDGSRMVRLEGRFMEYSIAEIDAAGKVRLRCVQDPGALGRSVRTEGATSGAAPEEE